MISVPFFLPVIAFSLGVVTVFLIQRPLLQAVASAVGAALTGLSLLFPAVLTFVGLSLSGDVAGIAGRVSPELLPGLAAWWLGLAVVGPLSRWSARPAPFFLPLFWLTITVWQIALVAAPPISAVVAGVLALAVAAPLLSSPGAVRPGGGTLFYAVLGLVLVLIANWQAQWSEAEPLVLTHALAATLALGLGCMLLLGAFPFRVWSDALQADSDPGSVALVALALQPAAMLMTLALVQDLGWLRAPLGVAGLRLAGLLSVLAAAAMAYGEPRLERLMNHVLLFDVGAALLAFAGQTVVDRQVIVAMIAVRALGLTAWATGLVTLRKSRTGDAASLQGLGLRLPLATAVFLAGPLAIAGYPLLAGFPLRWALLAELGAQDPTAALALVAALAGIGFATFRSLTAMITPLEGGATLRFEDRGVLAAIAATALMALLLTASYPQFWFWLFQIT